MPGSAPPQQPGVAWLSRGTQGTTSPTSSSVRHFFLRPREGGVVTVTSRYLIKQLLENVGKRPFWALGGPKAWRPSRS